MLNKQCIATIISIYRYIISYHIISYHMSNICSFYCLMTVNKDSLTVGWTKEVILKTSLQVRSGKSNTQIN